MLLRIDSIPCGNGVFNHDALRAAFEEYKSAAQVFIRESWGWEPLWYVPFWSEHRQFRLEVKTNSKQIHIGTLAHVGVGRPVPGQTTLVSALAGLNSPTDNSK